jgi:radical SAM protein with 4Fe4S-binding SPASM domain
LTDVWQLAEAVNLRPEAFGGMAFHRQRGVTLEVDAEAYQFLCTCLAPHPLPPPDHPAARLVPQLVRLGFLCPAEVSVKQARLAPIGQGQALPLPSGNGFTLSAPETVHLAITARCNFHCPGCYVPRQPVGAELSTEELRHLIDQWAEMRVFQLAVGGGEPLLRDDLFEVLTYAHRQGIVPNLTTNGTLLTPETVHQLEEAGVGQVNVSVNGPTANGDGDERTAPALRALHLLLSSSLAVGVNLLVTPALLPSLSYILGCLHGLVRQVTMLRPKLGYDASWYAANRLHRRDLVRLRQVMDAWQGTLHLEVGSALVCLMGDVQPGLLRRRAVHGCAAGRRICTVWPEGRVTPCSFLPQLNAGNVRDKPFALIWREGWSWEELRDPSALPGGRCDGCPISHLCGGARCLAWHERGDLNAGDAECPRFDYST